MFGNGGCPNAMISGAPVFSCEPRCGFQRSSPTHTIWIATTIDRGKRDPNFQTEQWCFNVARAPVRRELMRTDKIKLAQQKRVLSSRMGRYLQSADKHLNNVCKGIFP